MMTLTDALQIRAYIDDACDEMIATAAKYTTPPESLASNISADSLESAAYTTLLFDPEPLYALISLELCNRLDCDDSALCSNY